jgi:flagellin
MRVFLHSQGHVTGHRPLSHPWDSKRQLGINQTNSSKSMERLSSGMRINRAGDDAAGLAISEKMRGQIRGLKQAARNAQDGISLIQTAEGALNETHAILQRMRELATQASTDTNTGTDRAEIQKEIDQLAEEITRIAETTQFNTQELLDGTLNVKFHIGANSTQNVELGINAMTSKALGLETAGKFTAQVEDLKFDTKDANIKSVRVVVTAGAEGEDGAASATLQDGVLTVSLTVGGTGAAKPLNLDMINDALEEYGVQASGDLPDAGTNETVGFGAVVATIGGIDEAYANIADADIKELVFAGNDDSTIGVSVNKAARSAEEGGGYKVIVTVGQDVTLKELNAALKGYGIQIDSHNEDVNGDTVVGVISGAVTLDTDAGNIAIRVDTQASADKAITTINDAIEKVSTERSKLGAMQNRLEHTIANLGTSAENLQAAESRIRDLDMAEEMMAFTKNNILQQAATAMLAQANMAPQSVLQLLG